MSFRSYHFEKIGSLFERSTLPMQGIILLQRLILTCHIFFSFKYTVEKTRCIYNSFQAYEFPRQFYRGFIQENVNHGTEDLEFHLNLRQQKMLHKNRQEVLSISMNGSRGSGISSSGGVFKNSFSVYLAVAVVLIIILYSKGLVRRIQQSCCQLFICKALRKWAYV